MKKYLIGFIVGVVAATAGSVYADDIVLVGKQIEGQTTVYKDGEAFDTAIIVDNKSYAPIRSIGESAGYEVAFDEGEVYLNTMDEQVEESTVEDAPVVEVPVTESEAEEEMTIEQINERIGKLNENIANLESRVAFYQKNVDAYNKVLNDSDSTEGEVRAANEFLPGDQAHLEKYKGLLEERKAELAELEAKKAELEAQESTE